MQSASTDGNQHARRILRCTSERYSPIAEHSVAQSVAVCMKHPKSQSVAISGPSHLHERERVPVVEHRVDLTQGAVRCLEMRWDVPVGKGVGAVMSTCMLWRGSGRFVASRCDGMYQ